MAHPLPQTAENLVALDAWVRRGGRVLLLADPMLEWPSKRPLGDPLRPPPMFMDTGLLTHWGLRLDAPGERGPQAARAGGREVLTVSPGTLSGNCDDQRGPPRRAIAMSAKADATIVADADLLDVDHLDRAGRAESRSACLTSLPCCRAVILSDSGNHRLIHRARCQNIPRTDAAMMPPKAAEIRHFPRLPIKSHKIPLYPAAL